jgi:hypothetical protein
MRTNYIYNKVKSLAALLLLMPCATFLTGCNDFLESEPKDRIVLEKFWNEKSDVENVLVSCYSAMQASNVLGHMMVWGEFRSDNIEEGTNISNNVNLQRIVNENIDATNGYTSWAGFYHVINRCNTVMLYAPQVAAKDPSFSDSQLKATIAEATAIRALCYFYLIRTFRDVPYVTEAYLDDSQKMDIAATPFSEVLDALIADLESVKGDAMERYPKNQALYQTGRITKQGIQAMLCEMYLWKQDYAKCAQEAKDIIDAKIQYMTENSTAMYPDPDGRLNGYPLESDFTGSNVFGRSFGRLFCNRNDDASDGDSEEILLELVFMNNDNMTANGPVNELYGNAVVTRGYAAPAEYLTISENQSYNVYEKTDSRYYENIFAKESGSVINKYVATSAMSIEVSGTTIKAPTVRMVYARDKNHANWVIYRLSDIMLMRAEALCELGSPQNLADAFELVQTVNNRSLCETTLSSSLRFTSYNTQDKLRKLILLERQRELMFEGKRWYDLVRRSLRDGNTDVLIEFLGYKTINNASVALRRLSKLDAIFWPYYIEELRVNDQLKQNPAFSSGENESFTNTAK